MNEVKVAVIGVGNIGYVHAKTIYNGEIKGFKLCALCDINKSFKQIFDNEFCGVPFYESYEELLEKGDIDAVIISTPHPLHSIICKKAFLEGKHVLVEKPVDISLKNALEVNEIAKMSGKKFAIMFNQRTNNLFRKAKEIVSSGALGELKRSVWIITNWYRTQEYYNTGNWRATWSGEGGGVLVNQAPHQLDLWQWICGMPVSVTAFCDVAKYHDIEVEDDATINVRFENGAQGVFITSTGEIPGSNRLEISASRGKIVIENGLLKWWKSAVDERDYCYSTSNSGAHNDYIYEEIEEEALTSPHKLVLQNFADAIINDEELIANGYEGLNSLAIQNAAYLSSWQGNRTVELPFDLTEFETGLAFKKENSIHSYETKLKQRKKYSSRWQIKW